MRKYLLPAIALGVSSIMLTACGESAPEAPADPEAPAGVVVGNGRMMLPAVAGNPAVVYFDISNNSDRSRVIRAVAVQGAASAMLHETATVNDQTTMADMYQVNLGPQESLKFEPGGLHVMAMEPDETLVAGGKTEVTLTFGGGDKVSFPAEIREAGDER